MLFWRFPHFVYLFQISLQSHFVLLELSTIFIFSRRHCGHSLCLLGDFDFLILFQAPLQSHVVLFWRCPPCVIYYRHHCGYTSCYFRNVNNCLPFPDIIAVTFCSFGKFQRFFYFFQTSLWSPFIHFGRYPQSFNLFQNKFCAFFCAFLEISTLFCFSTWHCGHILCIFGDFHIFLLFQEYTYQ